MTEAPKRPRDLNEWAKRMVDIATGEVGDAAAESPKQARARRAGEAGGPARAKALSPEQKSDIARLAAEVRWKKS